MCPDVKAGWRMGGSDRMAFWWALMGLLALHTPWAQGQDGAIPEMSAMPETAVVREPGTYLRPMAVSINQLNVGDWVLLEREGGLFATADMLREWRLRTPANPNAMRYKEQTWWPLFALPGYRARFDYSHQAMQLEFSPEAFSNTLLANARPTPPRVSPAASAVFLNYDLTHTWAHTVGDNNYRDTGALTELGLAVGSGTLVSSQLGRNLSGSSPDRLAQWRRLETTWTRDFQAQHLSLKLGDSQTRASLWGRSVFFGGLQIGSNFSLTPGFWSQPIPTLTGTASSPGTLELYVNNALRQTSNVPAGPFTIENFTPLTGAGEARVVVRDVLGRETVLVQPFFSNTQLLEKGLSDWSLSLGRTRYNLGVANDDYRERFVSGLYRQGLSSALTLEGRAEGSRQLQSVGLGVSAELPFGALGQAATAFSRDDTAGRGAKMLLGIDHQSLRSGFNAKAVMAQRRYRELGWGANELPYKHEQSASYRYTLDAQASLALSAARLVGYAQGRNNLITASYSLRVAERGTLIFSGTRVTGNNSGYSVGLSLLLPLEGKTNMNASLSKSARGWDGYVAAAESAPLEGGHGWRVLAGQQSNQKRAEAGYDYLNDKAWLAANASTTGNGNAQTLRLNAIGALVAIDGSVFATRKLQESFALVEVKDYPGIGVGFLGGPITRTNAQGRALLPRLVAYQNNPIRLDANDLPFSAELDNLEQSPVPGWRSGVKVSFPVRSGKGALLRVLLDDGEPAPTGATVSIVGDEKEFFVARRGEAFVTGLQPQNQLQLRWQGQSCDLQVRLPTARTDDILRIGPLPCSGVSR